MIGLPPGWRVLALGRVIHWGRSRCTASYALVVGVASSSSRVMTFELPRAGPCDAAAQAEIASVAATPRAKRLHAERCTAEQDGMRTPPPPKRFRLRTPAGGRTLQPPLTILPEAEGCALPP